jgi:multidrug efflux pump
MVGLGIIALAGIVVNNNIVLIDTYNQYRLRGLDAIAAALVTGRKRLRPVFLTAFTTVLGLMPMVLAMNINLIHRTISFGAPSTQLWTQLASAIAGGLTFATLLTLILTPCLLVLGDRTSARLSRLVGTRKKSSAVVSSTYGKKHKSHAALPLVARNAGKRRATSKHGRRRRGLRAG